MSVQWGSKKNMVGVIALYEWSSGKSNVQTYPAIDYLPSILPSKKIMNSIGQPKKKHCNRRLTVLGSFYFLVVL